MQEFSLYRILYVILELLKKKDDSVYLILECNANSYVKLMYIRHN